MPASAPGAPSRGTRRTERAHASAAPDFERVAGRAVEELHGTPDPHEGLARLTETLSGEVAGSAAVGVLLDDTDGLRVAAASSRSLPALVCVDAACGDGPASLAYRTGRRVVCHQLAESRFALFAPAAAAAGFGSAYGLPIGEGPSARGALLLLSSRPRALDGRALRSLASVTATVASVLDDTGGTERAAALPPPHGDARKGASQ